MNSLPDLDQLTVAQKDDLIRSLFAQGMAFTAKISQLTAEIAELKGRLAQNSQNSSKPPSSDGLNKPKPKSLRKAGQRPTGGQKGHRGTTLEKVVEPDYIKRYCPPSHCDVCQQPLDNPAVVDTRQVFDLPALHYEVTEHQLLEARCACGKLHRGAFPEDVLAPVQYGPRIKAAAVNLNQYHMMPLERTGEVLGDLFDLPMSDASILAATEEASARLTPTVNAIGDALKKASIAGADETGMRIGKALHWMHVLVTETLTWMGCHPKRGKEAFEAFGLLTAFVGALIHDGWMPYRDLNCRHGLCNAHHLRELTYVFEEMGQAWAKRLIDLLVATCHEVAEFGRALPAPRIADIRAVYADILAEGDAANPRATPSGRRGRVRQTKAANLLRRLHEYTDDVWRFMTDPGVPFSNNLAEQAVRMPKVKQKVSGCFRTQKGAEIFCTIRSYLATLRKQGQNPFEALVLTFQGKPPQPSFD